MEIHFVLRAPTVGPDVLIGPFPRTAARGGRRADGDIGPYRTVFQKIDFLKRAVLCFAAGSAAADTLQTITAYLDPGITITMDGEAQTLTDAKGARIYPITYNGSTHLPVRAVAGLAGLEVNWDQATKTVQLGKMSTDVDLIDTYEAYDISSSDSRQIQSASKQEAEISGISCSHWLKIHQSWGNVGKGHIEYASFNVLGKYETLTFQTEKLLGDGSDTYGDTYIFNAKLS